MSHGGSKISMVGIHAKTKHGYQLDTRREFRGETKRAWRGRKTHSKERADLREARTGDSDIGYYVPENGLSYIGMVLQAV